MTKRLHLVNYFRQHILSLVEWMLIAIRHDFFVFSHRQPQSVSCLSLNDILDDDFVMAPTPLDIHIPNDQVIYTTMDLPLAARRQLTTSILLRLESLSPWPLDDTLWAVSSSKTFNDRLHVHIALTRRTPIELAKQHTPSFLHQRRVISLSPDAQPYLFDTTFGRGKSLRESWWPQSVALLGCVAILLWAVGERMDKILLEQKQQLLRLIQHEKQLAQLEERLLTAANSSSTSSDILLTEQLTLLAEALNALPPELWVSDIAVQDRQVIIDGHHTGQQAITVDERRFSRGLSTHQNSANRIQLIYRASHHDLATQH